MTTKTQSDFADEWFEKKDDQIFQQSIFRPHASLTVKWMKVFENDKEYHKGDYVTLSFENMEDAKTRSLISNQLVEILDKICLDYLLQRILVVGLGNEEMISDAIGPKTISQILVSAHLFEYEENVHPGLNNCAAVAPKVMGQTGLESARIVKGIVDFYKPQCVLVVDALATDSFSRINRAIQISNIGIVPGSGVGNHRLAINEETLHIPVISIGIATVTTIRSILKEMNVERETPHNNCIITPRDMDLECRQIVSILSHAINCFIHPAYEEL